MKILDRSRSAASGSAVLPRPRRAALLAASSALMITLTAASAMAATPAPTPSADGPAPDASVVSVRALTSAEIQTRGLVQFVQPGATGRIAPGTSTAASPQTSAAAAASACWTASIKQPGWLGMDGYGSEDWCASGGWITYAARSCWGTDGWYPTYNYLGCSTSAYYGKGWNVADTQYNWDLCIAWWGGGCAKHRHLWDRYRFGATGRITLISHGG